MNSIGRNCSVIPVCNLRFVKNSMQFLQILTNNFSAYRINYDYDSDELCIFDLVINTR